MTGQYFLATYDQGTKGYCNVAYNLNAVESVVYNGEVITPYTHRSSSADTDVYRYNFPSSGEHTLTIYIKDDVENLRSLFGPCVGNEVTEDMYCDLVEVESVFDGVYDIYDVSYLCRLCTKLRKVDFSKWIRQPTYNTILNYMFAGIGDAEIDLSGFKNFVEVPSCTGMFEDSKISNIDLSVFQYQIYPGDFGAMFRGADNIEEIDLSWITTNELWETFHSNGESKLKKIILPAVATISSQAFRGLTSLEEIYLNSSAPPKITGVDVFTGIRPGGVLHYYQDAESFDGLNELFETYGWTAVGDIDSYYFTMTWEWEPNDSETYDIIIVGTNRNFDFLTNGSDIYIRSSLQYSRASVPNTGSYTGKVYLKRWGRTNWGGLLHTAVDVDFSNAGPTNNINALFADSSKEVPDSFYTIQMLENTTANSLFRASSAAFDVSKFKSMDWTNVVDTGYMFAGWKGFTELDLSNWTLPNLTKCNLMFGPYPSSTSGKWVSLNLKNFNAPKLTNAERMFEYLSSLEHLDISGWSTPLLENVNSMIYNCSKLYDFKCDGWIAGNITNATQAFALIGRSASTKIPHIDLSQWTFNSNADCQQMFYSTNASKLSINYFQGTVTYMLAFSKFDEIYCYSQTSPATTKSTFNGIKIDGTLYVPYNYNGYNDEGWTYLLNNRFWSIKTIGGLEWDFPTDPIYFDDIGGSVDINFTSSIEIENIIISNVPDWLTFTRNGNTITGVASRNTGETRSVTLTFTADGFGVSKQLEVTQDALVWTLDTISLLFDCTSGTPENPTSSPISETVTYTSSTPISNITAYIQYLSGSDWLTVDYNGNIVVTATDNRLGNYRNAIITLYPDDYSISQQIYVSQYGSSFEWDATTALVDTTGGQVTFTYTAIDGYLLLSDITVANAELSWSFNGGYNGSITFTVPMNTGTARVFNPKVYAGNRLIGEFTITQEDPDITVDTPEIIAPAEGEDVVVNITSDLPWFTEVVGDWISVKPSKGDSSGNITITIAENPWSYVRTGYVYISNGIDREAIKITQVGADPILYFTKNYIPVPLKGGIKYVRLVNNTYWTTEWEIQ